MNFHLAFHLLSAKNNNTDGRITSTPISIVERETFLTTDGAAGAACSSTSKQDRFRKSMEKVAKLEDIAC